MSGSIAAGSLTELGYVAEVTFGTTPVSAAFQRIRDVSFSVNLQKEAYQSEERRSDRMRQDVRHGYRSVSGDITGELSQQSWDDFIQATMGGTWASSTFSTTFTGLAAAAGTNRFTVTSANFPVNGVRVGDVFAVTATPAIAGLTDRLYTALSVGISTIEVEPGTIGTTVTTSAVIRTVGQKVEIGTTYRSFSIERWLTDRSLYQQFKGVRFNQMTISVPASGLVGVTFSVIGQDGTGFGSSVASTYTAAPQTTPFAAVNGELYEGGSVLGLVTAAEISINNNMAGPQVVGTNLTPDLLFGRFADVTGTITVLFTNATMHNKFVSETESTLILRLQNKDALDSTTEFINLVLPRIKYSGGDVDDSPDTGITVTMPFVALKPLSTNTAQGTSSIVIQRGNG